MRLNGGELPMFTDWDKPFQPVFKVKKLENIVRKQFDGEVVDKVGLG